MIVKTISTQLLNEVVDFIQPIIKSSDAVFQRTDPFQKVLVQNRQSTVQAMRVGQDHQLCSALDAGFFADLVLRTAFLAENHRHLKPPMKSSYKTLSRFFALEFLRQPSSSRAARDDTWNRQSPHREFP